jgi:anaphase-promoting complex subunit 3
VALQRGVGSDGTMRDADLPCVMFWSGRRLQHAVSVPTAGTLEACRQESAALQDIAPREATVYFQIGKIYKKLKRPDAALTNFCHAMDLKPTSTDQNLIKSAIEKLHVDDDDADDEI